MTNSINNSIIVAKKNIIVGFESSESLVNFNKITQTHTSKIRFSLNLWTITIIMTVIMIMIQLITDTFHFR